MVADLNIKSKRPDAVPDAVNVRGEDRQGEAE